MRSTIIVAALCAAITSTAAAQGAVVPRPDTLGANFDDAHPGIGTLADYDFLIGKWTYRLQQRNPQTGVWSSVRSASWSASKPHGDEMEEDEFVSILPDGSRAIVMTYRVFDAVAKRWAVQGVGLKRGSWQPGISWSDGKDRFLVQDIPDQQAKVRIRYYAITPNHFQWRADGSIDGGKTWVRDLLLIEATRVP